MQIIGARKHPLASRAVAGVPGSGSSQSRFRECRQRGETHIRARQQMNGGNSVLIGEVAHHEKAPQGV